VPSCRRICASIVHRWFFYGCRASA
jgi:hypothetical protein